MFATHIMEACSTGSNDEDGSLLADSQHNDTGFIGVTRIMLSGFFPFRQGRPPTPGHEDHETGFLAQSNVELPASSFLPCQEESTRKRMGSFQDGFIIQKSQGLQRCIGKPSRSDFTDTALGLIEQETQAHWTASRRNTTSFGNALNRGWAR